MHELFANGKTLNMIDTPERTAQHIDKMTLLRATYGEPPVRYTTKEKTYE